MELTYNPVIGAMSIEELLLKDLPELEFEIAMEEADYLSALKSVTDRWTATAGSLV